MAWKDLQSGILEEFVSHVTHDGEWDHAAATDARTGQQTRRDLHRSMGLCIHCTRGAFKAKLCRAHYSKHQSYKRGWNRTAKGRAHRATRQDSINEWRRQWRERRRAAGLPVS
ncbi:MAG: hypothetical protein JWR83_2864 [Aeromicrobium sp.]|nr:hypothetical protein [Aeromicrobium sp.]